MKTTIKEIRKIIQEELSGLNETNFHRVEADESNKNNMLAVTIVSMGIENYAGGYNSEEDKLEYEQDILSIIERSPGFAKSLQSIIREIEGSTEARSAGIPPAPTYGVPEFEEDIGDIIEDFGYDASEGAYDARSIAGVALDKLSETEDMNQIEKEIPNYRELAVSIAKDLGFE